MVSQPTRIQMPLSFNKSQILNQMTQALIIQKILLQIYAMPLVSGYHDGTRGL